MSTRRPWSNFEQVRSKSFVHEPRDVSPDMLVDMASYGGPSIQTLVAYAQDSLIYSDSGIISADEKTYAATPRGERVNVFGLAYRRDAKLWLHKTLADIIKGAADYLQQTHGWKTVIYDGLRTVEGAFALYNFATDADLAAGLLALPGQSAHNKGLAVDSMMLDAQDVEVDMGGHFDHVDMSTNGRHYTGNQISEAAKKNRLIREAAFLRSAFSQSLLIAPLRSEFWDDRPPENRADLWRVLDSAARVAGVPFTVNREAHERWNYADFLANWQKTFRGYEEKLEAAIGHIMPPLEEKFEFYHGNYHPIYDRNLRKIGKHLTE